MPPLSSTTGDSGNALTVHDTRWPGNQSNRSAGQSALVLHCAPAKPPGFLLHASEDASDASAARQSNQIARRPSPEVRARIIARQCDGGGRDDGSDTAKKERVACMVILPHSHGGPAVPVPVVSQRDRKRTRRVLAALEPSSDSSIPLSPATALNADSIRRRSHHPKQLNHGISVISSKGPVTTVGPRSRCTSLPRQDRRHRLSSVWKRTRRSRTWPRAHQAAQRRTVSARLALEASTHRPRPWLPRHGRPTHPVRVRAALIARRAGDEPADSGDCSESSNSHEQTTSRPPPKQVTCPGHLLEFQIVGKLLCVTGVRQPPESSASAIGEVHRDDRARHARTSQGYSEDYVTFFPANSYRLRLAPAIP